MKTTNFLLSLMFILLATIAAASAQEVAAAGISLTTANGRTAIHFTVPREVNVRHYRIEASDDSVHFGVVATLKSKGNSVMPNKYSCDLTAWNYKYFRIAIVEMNGSMPYSAVVQRTEIHEAVPEKTNMKVLQPGSSHVLVKQ